MAEYRTPGVYIEEISQSTPSAAQVATAIPVFIGYTERAKKNGTSLLDRPTYISSLLEYHEYFGADYVPELINVFLDSENDIEKVEFEKQFYFYNSVRMFFANGGGQCCILSVGDYTQDIDKDKISAGIKISKKENLPTMIMMPDAVLLETKDECYALQQEALMLCQKMKDRVVVLDIYDGYKKLDDETDVIMDFRTGIGINGLPFGAAYYPWLQTLYKAKVSFRSVAFKNSKGKDISLESIIPNPQVVTNLLSATDDLKLISDYASSPLGDGSLKDKFSKVDAKSVNKKAELVYQLDILKKAIYKLVELRDTKFNNPTFKNEAVQKTNKNSLFATLVRSMYAVDLATQTTVFDLKKDFVGYELSKVEANESLKDLKEEASIVAAAKPIIKSLLDNFLKFIASLKTDALDIEDQFDKGVYENVQLYKNAVGTIYQESSKLPPSGAIAGIYSQVDDNRGVWKAPANVSVSNTVKPWVDIDHEQQENLNIDPVGGKSINAIRAFPGQGNLVWGARTLAGNDSEWRYISVRRFFNMAEKTLKQGSAWAVFEPNVEMTWIRIKAMMNNFLTNLWKAGALVGSTPDEAFFVNIGLGSTMTPEDILEGKLIIEVGMAVVRPAEFIIIKFSHKAAGAAEAGGEE